jgi:solute:Na+ symporter, SSS family
MDNGLYFADYAVITGFFAVMVGIGIYFQGKVKNMGDFFGGGKQVPWWLAGISFYMCSFSALGFVVYSALAYQYGFVAVTIYWLTVPAMLIGAKFMASRWRRIAQTSPLEYIESRYGNKMRQGLVWVGIPTRILDDALKLLAIGTVVAAGMGFPLTPAIIVSGLIMISYTFMGGLWAALVADFIQFIVLLAAVLVLPFLTLKRAGGLQGFIEAAPEGFFSLINTKYTWGYLLVFFFIILLNYTTSWALVQRYYSTSSDKNARKVGYLVAILNFVGPPIFYIPAMTARVFLPEIENSNEVYAIVCKSVLPVGMIGMIIAAMFSATMSMLAGDFNAVASVLTNDIYKRMISNEASAKKLMLFARVNTLIVGLVVIGITIMIRKIQGSDDLFRVMVKIFGLFLPPVAIPMLVGMFSKRVSNFGGLLGFYAGIITGFTAFVIGGWYPYLREEQIITSITSFTTIAGLIAGTFIKPDSAQRSKEIDSFVSNAASKTDVVTVTEENDSVKALFPIISIGTFAIGLVLAVSVLFTNISQGKLSIAVGTAMMAVGCVFMLIAKKTKSDNT